MGARRFVNEILVISPMMLIAGITVQARTSSDTYIPVRYSPSTQQRVAAYIEPVRLVEEVNASGVSMASPPKVRKIALTWRNMTRDGVLTPLRPESPDDSFREGIKGQIRRAADELASTLQYIAHQALQQGKPYQAAEDAVLAMEAVQGVKYSDLYSIGMFAVRENASLHLLKQCSAQLNDAQRFAIRSRLAEMREREEPLANIVIATQRVNQSPASGTVSIEKSEFQLALNLAKAVDRQVDSPEFRNLYQELAQNTRAKDQQNFLPEFRFALNASRNVKRDWQRVAALLS